MHSGVATNRDHINGTLNLNVRLHRSGTKFPGAFPRLSCPQPIGCYSLNESRQFQDYASNVSYLNLPHRTEFPLDLNAGIERVQRKGEAAHKYKDIHDFCRYICNHQQELSRPSTDQKKGPNLSYDFVTFRGILRQIMCTPYERRKDYRLMATRLNGTIYLAKVETEADRLERESMTKQQLDMCSWGFKFEQYCTTVDPKKLPDTTSPVNEAKEFDCVFHLTLNGLQVLFAAEMDGIKSNGMLDMNDRKQLAAAEFVELKTSAHTMNRYQQRSFDSFKSLNWWCQSFLVGIRTIFVGLRDKEGLAHRIEECAVGELHRNKPWSPAAVTIFLSNFLHELKLLMEHIDNSDAIVMLDFKATQDQVFYSVIRDDIAAQPEEQLLPTWYRSLVSSSGTPLSVAAAAPPAALPSRV